MLHVKLVDDFSQGKKFYLNGKEYACVDVTSPTNGMFDFVLRSDDKSLFIVKVWIHKYGSGDFYYRVVVSGKYVGKINQHQINEIIR